MGNRPNTSSPSSRRHRHHHPQQQQQQLSRLQKQQRLLQRGGTSTSLDTNDDEIMGCKPSKNDSNEPNKNKTVVKKSSSTSMTTKEHGQAADRGSTGSNSDVEAKDHSKSKHKDNKNHHHREKDEKVSSKKSSKKAQELHNAGMTIRAAILIQKWYKGSQARLEARRQAAWKIFQTIEYAGEQDQMQMYNFFSDLLSTVDKLSGSADDEVIELGTSKGLTNAALLNIDKFRQQSVDQLSETLLLEETDPNSVDVPKSYVGLKIEPPITARTFEALHDYYKQRKKLHAHYALVLLHEARKVLKSMPTVRHASTSISKHITVCGDLHGKLEDLYIIWYKNGVPSVSNPFIFNGDFVDRGQSSLEIALLLFAALIANPTAVFINRGNHEDPMMNFRYGFVKEVMSKYGPDASRIYRLLADVFSWLPIATVIDDRVLVCHGGIGDGTDIGQLSKIQRAKFVSVLSPPLKEAVKHELEALENKQPGGAAAAVQAEATLENRLFGGTVKKLSIERPRNDAGEPIGTIEDAVNPNMIDYEEWKQILDVLWSDPQPNLGTRPNIFRGGGCYFGPDVTKRVLQRHGYQLLIRSHECKQDGFEWTHDNYVLTIFSASNYYEEGSNRGAYVKLEGPELSARIVQYRATRSHQRLTRTQRVSAAEQTAMRELREKLYANKDRLTIEFRKYDPVKTGMMKGSDWAASIEEVMHLELPWRTLRPRLVRSAPYEGVVEYMSTFEDMSLNPELPKSEAMEKLYKNKEALETIFRAMDKDQSGVLSMEEFESACHLLVRKAGLQLSAIQVRDMAISLDINKDGSIDFNEFLEAFRIVSQTRSVSTTPLTSRRNSRSKSIITSPVATSMSQKRLSTTSAVKSEVPGSKTILSRPPTSASQKVIE